MALIHPAIVLARASAKTAVLPPFTEYASGAELRYLSLAA